jgi:hypothetical protein
VYNETLSVAAMCVAIQIVRPLESIAQTQQQLQPPSLEIVSDYFPVFRAADFAYFVLYVATTN